MFPRDYVGLHLVVGCARKSIVEREGNFSVFTCLMAHLSVAGAPPRLPLASDVNRTSLFGEKITNQIPFSFADARVAGSRRPRRCHRCSNSPLLRVRSRARFVGFN